MKGFNNLKISTKLLTGFILVALIAGAMGLYGMLNIKMLADSDAKLYKNMTIPISQMSSISTAFQRMRVNVRDMIIAQDPTAIQDNMTKIEERLQEIDNLSVEFEKTIVSPEMTAAFNSFTAARTAYKPQLDRVISLAKENKDEETVALMSETGDVGKASRVEQDAIEKIINMKVADSEGMAAANEKQANSTMLIMGILIFIAMGLSVILGWFISKSISEPLKKAVHMIREMSMGHLGLRLKTDTKDEIGQMAKAMDSFADDLQNVVIGTMKKISDGDVSLNISPRDDKDEIAPALKNTIETIRSLVDETGKLIKATQEGKLNTRGNATLYLGSWKELVIGINSLIDAFVAPINVTADYINRISKGDIPKKITDTYLGDFNEIKNNLNTCIDAVNALVADANMLSVAAIEGRLATRADASKHGGDFARIVDGVNKTLDAVIGPLNVAADYVDKISKGDIPPKITDTYNGDFNTIKNNLNTCIGNINALVADANILEKAAIEGKLATRADASKHGGDYRKIVDGVNNCLNAVIGPLNVAADYVDRISKGNIPAKITDNYNGDFNTIKNNLNTCIDAVNALVADANMLCMAAVEGKLSTRADASKHGGDFAKIVDGVNKTLDAVIKPVQEAAAVLNEMANGNLQMRVTGNYNGDHAEIKNALNETLDALSTYVDEIASVLTEMANSNMVVEISGDYKGDFAPIKQALNLIIESFNQVLSDINNAADQVAAGSRQVSDGSQALSQGATEQASSIEQLTASITEIAAQTKQNAVSANEANELALTAKNNATAGNDQMKDMLKAMEEINISSANISKIIKVIDEIAFQTNILALNAAVEAARAGQHGKGFAVVAEEVRNLAARSASAAKETTGLIEGSIKKVETGTKIANETAVALDKIVVDVAKAANLVGTIATASNEQATGIAQVNQGVEQVSMVVQTNSATAEESAAASEELSSQADLLKEMIGRFRLKGGEGQSMKSHLESGMKRLLSDGGAAKRQTPENRNAKKDAGIRKNARIALSDAEFGKY
jgi:methyl-accepting chemotaxis protein